LAEQDAVLPPFAPAHDQFHGPEPLTPLAVPLLHNPLVGADETVVPLVEPQAPFTGVAQAALALEQDAVLPPFAPTQDHDRVVPQAVAPLSPDAEPAEQAPALALHTPLTAQAALALEQDAVVPPFCPAQDHVRVVPQAVAPLSPVAEPAVQAPAVELQAPLTAQAALEALQDAVVPPFTPVQDHVRVVPQAVALLSAETEPAEQAPAVALQAPLTGAALFAAQLWEVPTGEPPPAQVHVHGPVPLTADAVPDEHRLLDGAAAKVPPLTEPQVPGIVVAFCAWQPMLAPAGEPEP
jgi:hypothetical protein